MANHKVNLLELRDVDVTHISLVDRAASRIGFRILKRDSMGIDLGKILKREPKVIIDSVTVMAQKGELAVGVEKVIKDAGFDVTKGVPSGDGTCLTFSQNGGDPSPAEDVQLVRLSDQCVVALKGFEPAHAGMKEADFGDTASANSFYQGVDGSLDTLFTKICDTLTAATDEKDAATKIATLCDGFKAHVVQLAKSLPTAAFKADMNLRSYLEETMATEVEKTEIKNIEAFMTALQAKPAGFANPVEWDKMSPVDKISWLRANTAPAAPELSISKGDDCAQCKAVDGWATMSTEDKGAVHSKHQTVKLDASGNPIVEPVAEVVPPVVPAVVVEKEDNPVLKAIEALAAKVDGIGVEVKDLATKRDEDKKVLDATVAKNEDLVKKLGSTVTAPAPPADIIPGSQSTVTKGEDDDPRVGNFDTAFTRKREVKVAKRSL